ncbi:MAG TPA: ABC transporter permease [Chloroflexota bacterium]|nr:ABC transporter permease [Chloroflexota bacterium]
MLNFVVRRLAQGALTVLLVTIIVFFLVNTAPGGPGSIMRPDMTQAERQALIVRLGLNQPVPVRYLSWLGGAVHGDLGTSLSSSLPVGTVIGQRLPNTAELAILTLLISVVAGVVLGVTSAMRRGGVLDYLVGLLSVAGLSVPVFWFAILLILFFSVDLHWLPASGMSTGAGFDLGDRLQHAVMPVLVLALTTLPNIIRFARASMIEALTQDYVRTARAKGLKRLRIAYVHVLRNALLPVISTIGVLVPRLLGGAVITETVFGWPGMGQLMFEAASSRDYPLVMGITVVMALAVVLVNLAVDVLYSVIDPRIRVS